jgi:hypothetical protein
MPIDMESLRLVIYEPYGERMDIYAEPKSLTVAMVYGSPGDSALSLTVNNKAHASEWLERPHEIAIEMDGVEIPDGRFIVLGDKSDPVDGEERDVEVTAFSYYFLLQKTKVLRDGASTAPKRTYTDTSPGYIMRDLIGDAKSQRGMLEGVYVNFNDPDDPSGDNNSLRGKDSAGQDWPTLIDIKYDYGLDLLSVLKNLVEQGLCDVEWDGRKLNMYAPGSRVYTGNNVIFNAGVDITAAPSEGTLVDYATRAIVLSEGDEATGPVISVAEKTIDVDGNTPPWGPWEVMISQQSVSSISTIEALAFYQLTTDARRKKQYTCELRFSEESPVPFIDYTPGDWMDFQFGLGPALYLRCRQITVTRDESGGWGGNLVVNDRFVETELAIARKVRGITGGSDVLGGVG